MSTDENKDLVRRWVEMWNTGNLDAVDQLATSDFLRHDPNSPEVRGPEAERQLIAMYRAAFPDLQFTIEDLIAEGDKVVGRFVARGTHRGELLGIPPTQASITVATIEIYRIEAHRIAEQWVIMDALGIMQQLGVVPPP
jgi:steroid delta-isomerase-like uncharacterized protein